MGPAGIKEARKVTKAQTLEPAPSEIVAESDTFEPEKTTRPKCGTRMERAPSLDSIYQRIDLLKEQLARIVEARGAAHVRPCCGGVTKGIVPEEIGNRPLIGPRPLALIIALRFGRDASFRAMSAFLKATIGLGITIGCPAKTIVRSGDCLANGYKEIEEHIGNEPVVHVDETPHVENGVRRHTWVFVTAKAILFAIGDRSRDMLDRVPTPDYVGIIRADYYGVYISYVKNSDGRIVHQACLAHLKRESRRRADHILDPDISRYGEKMLKLIEDLFKARDEFNADKTPENLERFRQAADDFNREGEMAPNKGVPARLAKRFASGSAYTTFVSNPEVDATNNRSERAIRKIVISRHVTQGTRSEGGRHASERFWSVKATRELQGGSYLDHISECHEARSKGKPTPSILKVEWRQEANRPRWPAVGESPAGHCRLKTSGAVGR
jgi:hypothetical protein